LLLLVVVVVVELVEAVPVAEDLEQIFLHIHYHLDLHSQYQQVQLLMQL
jgi:hypothetical protein